MLEEKKLLENQDCRDKVLFMMSLLRTLLDLKQNSNIDDVYINFNLDKIEIYVFNYDENFDTEDFITETIVEWERQQNYFPELFINTSDGKMNVLPRTAIRVC